MVRKEDQKIEMEEKELSYLPQGGLGIRSNQHFFPPGKEKIFIDGQTHLEESYNRRKSTLEQFHQSEVQMTDE